MDTGGLVVLLLTLVLLGGPLSVLLVRRRPPVPRDWSGRARSGVATSGETPYDGG